MIINGVTRGTRRRHGTGPEPARVAGSAVGNAASSALEMPGCWRGSSWKYHHHTAAQTADKMPTAINENLQENQVISKATIGAAVPAPARPAAWVAPIAVPRASIGIHFESARVAAGKVAPSPMPSTKRTPNRSANQPPTS